jgi:hypothetical protein
LSEDEVPGWTGPQSGSPWLGTQRKARGQTGYGSRRSDINLFGYGKSIIDLDAEIPNRCPYRKPHLASVQPRIERCSLPMIDFLRLLACALTRLFRSRARLEAEILVLRHQLNVLRRKSPKRVALSNLDRMMFVGFYRLAPGVLHALKIVNPETLIR